MVLEIRKVRDELCILWEIISDQIFDKSWRMNRNLRITRGYHLMYVETRDVISLGARFNQVRNMSAILGTSVIGYLFIKQLIRVGNWPKIPKL